MLSKLSDQTHAPEYSFDAIGTHWRIETSNPLPRGLRTAIERRIAEFDRCYSRFRNDSIVSAMSQRAGRYVFPPDVINLLAFYRRLYEATDGKVTPLIGHALEQSGYDKEYSFQAREIEQVPEWDEAMEWRGNEVITTMPVLLDVGAAGKGCLVDIVAEILEMHGISEYVIDASGDIRHRGKQSERVGLENPYDLTRVIGVMNLQNASLCGSAGNRRQWGGGMHHILDPSSRSPTRDVAATWVKAESTMVADGLATALFFVGNEKLQHLCNFEFVRLFSDTKLSHSHNFMGELFI